MNEKEYKLFINEVANTPLDILLSRVDKSDIGYRAKDEVIRKNLLELVTDSHKFITTLVGNYKGFWFIILYPFLLLYRIISIGLPYVIKEMKKPKLNYVEHFKLDRKSQKVTLERFQEAENNSDDDFITPFNIKMREYSDTLTDQYHVDKDAKINKAKIINELRSILYENDMILQGTIIEEIKKQASDLDFIDSLRTGSKVKDDKELYISFGENGINSLLAEIVPNYLTLKNEKNKSYLVLLESNIELLEKKLSSIYQEDIKVLLD